MGQPQEYDATLKLLQRGSAGRALREVTGATIGKLGEAEDQTLGDNVIAIVARLRQHKDAVRRIVERIAVLAAADRVTALEQLLILSGLRRLEEVAVEREARKMPIHIDILESKVLGREYKRGRQKGKLEGELRGGLKVWAEERLASRTTAELEDLSVRPLDAQSLEELLN